MVEDYDGLIPQRFRAWVYRVLGVASAVAVFYGVVAAEEAALWVSAVTALVGNGLAAVNTRTR